MSKIISKDYLGKMSDKDMMDQMERGKSLLLSLGLYGEYIKVFLFRIVIRIFWFFSIGFLQDSKENSKKDFIREKLGRVLGSLFPMISGSGWNVLRYKPVVIGFHHSTSGDIFRVLGFLLPRQWGAPIVLPSSLIFYEACQGIKKDLDAAEIIICPIISRDYCDKIKTEKNRFLVHQMRVRLETCYQVSINECVKANGTAIVPIGFDRRKTVFRSKAEFTGRDKKNLSLDITKITRFLKKHKRVNYVAMGVDPRSQKRGLNVFRVYAIEYSIYLPDQIQKLRSSSDRYELEYSFLSSIAKKLPYSMWHPKEE